MSDKEFWTRLRKDKDNNEYWVECGIKFEYMPNKFNNELGVIAYDEDRNDCLIKAASIMSEAADELLEMVE
jgi:hypothetical protein